MDAWLIWLIAAVAATVGEMLTLSFFLAPFALGAVAGMVVDLAGGGSGLSFAAFAVVTAVTFLGLRPVAKRHARQPAATRTGTAALIGQQAMVLERIANNEGVGCVKIAGEVWTARAYDDDDVIEQGVRVQVVEIRGATALVQE